MSTPDKVREIVREEVAKANPHEDRRQSIERFVLSQVQGTEVDGNLTITVLDDERQPLPGGTIQDLIAGMRLRRPELFRAELDVAQLATSSAELGGLSANEEAPVEVTDPARLKSVVAQAAAGTIQTPVLLPQSRDWLLLESVAGSRSGLAGSRPMTGEFLHKARNNPPPDPDRNMRQRHVLAGSVGILMIALCGSLVYHLLPPQEVPEPAPRAAPPTQSTTPPALPDHTATSRAADPARTGSIPAAPAPSRPLEPLLAEGLQGPAEVIDTATLSIRGKTAPLFGVQSRPGEVQPARLSEYLRGREVRCLPADNNTKAYRCEVEGQDLSRVVLFNGGGRAAPDATPELLAAETQARSAKKGLWAN